MGVVDLNALRAQAIGSGNEEEAVTVNTRALIDKVLARYSGEWTVLRELLQNAADASATKVTIKFETLPSLAVPVTQTQDSSALLKHTLLHHSLKCLLVSNNGNPFGQNDWSRLKRIAEGNPDETKIGAFGVGFYSVFADCEEPFVRSGKEAMAFYWKGNSLFTKRLQLEENQSSKETNFVLNYRNNTSPIPKLLTLCQFLVSSITFVGLSQIELWLDSFRILSLTKLSAPGANVKIQRTLETKTLEGLFRITSVERETAQVEAIWMNIVAWKPKITGANLEPSASNVFKGSSSSQSLKSFFGRFAPKTHNAAAEKAAEEEKITQAAISEDLTGLSTATVFLHINTATLQAKINASFGKELERATKKAPPASTKLAVLTSSYDEKAASTTRANGMNSTTDIFSGMIPSKVGRIFIGFPTHQTTGLCAHISAQSVIPTVERESIDLNARWVRTWNMEMLRAAGIICRIAWDGETNSLKQKLLHLQSESKSAKVRKEDVDKLLPDATHMLNQFTFRESTPSSQVGDLIEEAFWTCNKTSTIEILSTSGVLPSQNVRIATEELSFVDGIPVLPPELIIDANGFVKKLMEYGIITEMTTSDIKKELERQALTETQLVEFLRWIGRKSRIQEVDTVAVRSLLDVAVANDETGGPDSTRGKLILLGDIKHFINPSRIPGNVPVPSTTIPFKFTKNVDKSDLEALGWEDLQIVPWLRWLVEVGEVSGSLSKEHIITQSPSFACVVLPIISKQWDGLSQTSKSTIISLLSSRTVIPTRLGMRKPSEAYFPIVKLFDDLPVVSGLQSVKDKVLVALGVRKTVALELVFERLMASQRIGEPSSAQPAWSHVDLIRYLASVRNDIPQEDIKRLRTTPICPTVAEAGKATQERFTISNLFEPNETTRSLGLRILQWPSPFRASSEEGKFLSFLGLRSIPSLGELISIIAAATASGNIPQRERALKYLVSFHVQNGYSIQDSATTQTPYLPLEGEDPSILVLPTQCYTNTGSTVMGFRILRQDLHSSASRLGVQVNPPILDCVDRLVKSPPLTIRRAAEVFGYFDTRTADLSGRPLEILKQTSFVPILAKGSDSRGSVRHLPPHLCFLGDGQSGKYAEIFDYVDFGMSANTFLLRCGSKHEPSSLELAQLVVREPARIFTVFESPDRYLDLLRQLAGAWAMLKKDKALVKDMKKVPFLLGYKELTSDYNSQTRASKSTNIVDPYTDVDDVAVRTYELATADRIVIVDDVVSYSLFRGNFLAAPMEEDLENFYQVLGASSLDQLVQRRLQIGQPLLDQKEATQLEKLIRERIKLFMHEISRDQVRHDAAWIEKNLSIVVVKSLAILKSLKSHGVHHTEIRSAVQAKDFQLGHRLFAGYTLFVTSGTRDLYDVSQALSTLVLLRPKPQHAITLNVLLETDLHKLRARGYNVERILQRKAAEARVAEEQRRRQLDQERKVADEQTAIRAPNLRTSPEPKGIHTMPGVFPDSPDHKSSGSGPQEIQKTPIPDKWRGGFLSAITRTLGGDDGRQPAQNGDNGTLPPPPYSSQDSQHPTPPTQASPVTSPKDLQQNLQSAIKASRSHTSPNIVTNLQVNQVNESQSFCDAKPAQNISLYGQLSSGIKVYLSHKISDKERYMEGNASAMNAFVSILFDCAESVGLAKSSLHIFRDDDSSTIAFNQNKALFFNYRYFEKLHLPDVLQGKKDRAIIYWFVVLCHELAHNLVADHSSAHSYYTESFIMEYFVEAARKSSGHIELI